MPDYKEIIASIESLVEQSFSEYGNGGIQALIGFLVEDESGPKCNLLTVGLTETQTEYINLTKERYYCKLTSPYADLPLDENDGPNSIICTSDSLNFAVIKAALQLTEFLYGPDDEDLPEGFVGELGAFENDELEYENLT